MKLNDLVFINYKSIDDKLIYEIIMFFKKCGYNFNREFWNWINLNSPFGKTRFIVSKRDNIISHYSYIPRDIVIDGVKIKAGMGIHLASDPEQKSLSVLLEVFKKVYEIALNDGIEILYGFPNNNSYLILNRFMKWTLLEDIPALEKELSELQPVAYKNAEYIELENPDDNFFSQILNSIPKDYIYFNRTIDYLKWRYFFNPVNKYYYIQQKRGCGCAILKIYVKNGRRYGHILEIGGFGDDAKIFEEIVLSTFVFFYKKNVDIISLWFPENSLFCKDILYGFGFKKSDFLTHFGYLSIGDKNKILGKIKNKDWYITMGDSDAF